MRNTSFAGMHCSLAQSLEVMGDWWSPLILRDLYLGLDRFGPARHRLGHLAQPAHRPTGTMMQAGLIARTPYQDTRSAMATSSPRRAMSSSPS